MNPLKSLRLKKNEEKRLRAGHVWVYSNEIDITHTPLSNFTPGELVIIEKADRTPMGIGYVNPHSLIAARLLSSNTSELIDVAFFKKRILKAYTLRSQLFAQPYYRLVFGEGDGLAGLIIDRYNATFVLQFNTAGMDALTGLIVEAVQDIFPDNCAILLRNDSALRRQEGLETYIKSLVGTIEDPLLLIENETFFQASVMTGQKTGWFYDHRMNRGRLKDYVSKRHVLDVFSYLGGWGIQAAKFGAASVTCVDSSEQATQGILNNAHLNQVDSVIQTITDDAFTALKGLIHQRKQFDVIIIDPPAFVKKQKDKKEGLLAYQRINEMALKLLTDGGILISCSCSMQITFEDLLESLRRASYRAQLTLQIIERGHQSPDHPVHLCIPETDYIKMIIARCSKT